MSRVYFDTDCISSFLWTNSQSIVVQLYSGRSYIPEEVYLELSNPCVPHLKERIDSLIGAGMFGIERILVGTPEQEELYRLRQEIDDGEAAVIVLAKRDKGIVASNNLRDVLKYVKGFGLKHITTCKILAEALKNRIIDEDEGNRLFAEMIRRKRKLPFTTFSEYLASANE